jgi:L-rhamnose-H+ transport protein
MTGILLLLAGAACGGSFGLPSKFVKKETPWETLWGPFFFFVSLLIPTLVFPLLADDFFRTYAEAGAGAVVLPVAFGFLWGLGSMTLGMSFAFIGLSLAYAINYGAQIVTGGFIGLLTKDVSLTSKHGLVILAGIAVCLAGVVVCGRAAILKSQSLGGDEAMPRGAKLTKGLVVAFLSGILCACYGLAAGFGGPVAATWGRLGNAGWQSACVVAALILWGGSLSACGYCAFKFFKNKSWGTLREPGIGKILLIALLMALLHDGAIIFYGIGASYLGPLGTAVGYAMFMSFAIMVGNINGFLTGEWKGASRRSVVWIVTGIAVLMLGVCVLERGNNLHGKFLQQTEPTEAP